MQHRYKKITLGKVSLSNKSSGMDEFKYFPHKKVISDLLKQLQARFLRYQKSGYYDQYLGLELTKKVERVVMDGKPNLPGNLWADVLAEALKKCYQKKFDVKNLSLLSRLLIPIYRWRAASCWLEIENMTTREAEDVIRKEASRLRRNLTMSN